MFKDFILPICGIFFGWLFTHIYYKKSSKDQNDIIKTIKNMNDKQFKKFKELDNSKITIEKLNKLIEEKTFDTDAYKKGEPVPYFACPKCGGDLEKSGYNNGDIEAYTVKCKKCGWSESCGA